jgi:16S rRNA (uracil1498-N3)-methyltransferase
MNLPFFYITGYDSSQKNIILNEDTSRHIVQVLRMKTGDQINLTDGKGHLLTCAITDDHKKHCSVSVQSKTETPKSKTQVTIAISLLKNTNRFEWFLEKATEIGVSAIIPLLCERTEKEKFRADRLQGILISAMLQSQQTWLPEMPEPVEYKSLFATAIVNASHKFIAHCIDDAAKRTIRELQGFPFDNSILLIGPEGDFTPAEVSLALQHRFEPVSLGNTRLRTETAGIVAATLLLQ